MNADSAPRPPALVHTLTEPLRAGLEATRLAVGFERVLREAPRGEPHPVLVLPSYGTGDGGTRPMRRFLGRLGYATPPAALGRNVDRGELRIRRVEDAARFRAAQADRVVERVRAIHRETGRRVSLIGWSMGGLFALDASQCVPELVRGVVTLGSPFGDPRGTSMFGLMRRLSGSRVPVEEQDFGVWLERARLATDLVPITVIHSDRDGIVGRSISQLSDSPCVRHVRVDSSHLGFAAHPEVFREVALALGRSRDRVGGVDRG
jgi:pimeloyl-ACP methyl ester carboxylesterase